jgi:hypothetical protein
MAEAIYRNLRDTRRYRVYQRMAREGFRRGEWDVDVFTPTDVYSYASTYGDAFRTRTEARAWAEYDADGKLVSLPASLYPEVTSHWRAMRAFMEREARKRIAAGSLYTPEFNAPPRRKMS